MTLHYSSTKLLYPLFLIMLVIGVTVSCRSENAKTNTISSDVRGDTSESRLLISSNANNQSKIHGNNSVGVSIKVKGKKINPDSVAKPNTIPLKRTPKIVAAHSNVHRVGSQTVIAVPKDLIVFTPGESGIPLPKTVTAKNRIVSALQPIPVSSQLPGIKDGATHNFLYWDVHQGMIDPYVYSMLEDTKGYLWFGTYDGICRFDGTSFTQFTTKEGLSYNIVRTMMEDSKGNLWIGTSNSGVNRYDGNNFTHFTVEGGLSGNDILAILEDSKGNLWFGTGNGANRFDGNSFMHLTTREGLSDNCIYSILEDSEGNLWFGTRNGVNRYDGNSFTRFTTNEGLSNNSVLSMIEDKKGNLWFGTKNGLNRYDGNSFACFTTNEGLSNNNVWSMMEDNKGNLWFGTKNGVNRYDGNSFTHFTTNEGLSNDNILSIMEDSKGNLWFGTYAGVNRYNSNSFIQLIAEEELSNPTTSMLEDNRGNLWFGTQAGVNRYDGKNFMYLTTREGLSNNRIYDILEDSKGNLWFGTENGVNRYDGNSFTHLSTMEGLSDNQAYSLLEDSEGNLWFGTENGVNRYDGNSFTHFTINEGLSNNKVRSILEDSKGNLWFGTRNGVNRYDGNSVTTFPAKEGLSDNYVISMLEDSKGNLWFGTENGVKLFDGNSFTTFTTKDGLSHNLCLSIIEDNKNRIWISTQKGITLLIPFSNDYSFDADSKKRGFQFLAFGKQDGLKQLDFIISSACKDRNNNIYWGSQYGVTKLDLNNFNIPAEPPKVMLSAIEVKGRFVDFRRLSDTSYVQNFSFGNTLSRSFKSVVAFQNYPVDLNLPHDLDHLTFHFSGIDWAAPHKIQYRYYLEGLEDTWNLPNSDNKADYRNIPYGTYTFKVQAMGVAQIWNVPFEYTFTIRPPWWHTWWARLLYLTLALAAIYSYIRWRTYTLRKRQKELEQTISERTLEIQEKNVLLEKTLDNLQTTQQQLIQQEKMASLGQMTAGIAHEIKNPLNFVNNSRGGLGGTGG